MSLHAVPFRQEPYKKNLHFISDDNGGGKLKLGATASGRGKNSPVSERLAIIWLANWGLPMEQSKAKSEELNYQKQNKKE